MGVLQIFFTTKVAKPFNSLDWCLVFASPGHMLCAESNLFAWLVWLLMHSSIDSTWRMCQNGNTWDLNPSERKRDEGETERGHQFAISVTPCGPCRQFRVNWKHCSSCCLLASRPCALGWFMALLALGWGWLHSLAQTCGGTAWLEDRGKQVLSKQPTFFIAFGIESSWKSEACVGSSFLSLSCRVPFHFLRSYLHNDHCSLMLQRCTVQDKEASKIFWL